MLAKHIEAFSSHIKVYENFVYVEAKISEYIVTGIKYFYLSKYFQIKRLGAKARTVLKKLQRV
jgi:hypothetical protein